jgi:hypothetical protein
MKLHRSFDSLVFDHFVRLLEQALADVPELKGGEGVSLTLWTPQAVSVPGPDFSANREYVLNWSLLTGEPEHDTYRQLGFQLAQESSGCFVQVILTDSDLVAQPPLLREEFSFDAYKCSALAIAQLLVQTAVRFIRSRVVPIPGELQTAADALQS